MPHNSCSLLLAATWAVCMPFVEVHFSAMCYSSTACYTVCYLLPRPVQFVICCYTPYSLLVVAACHTVCYLLPHTIQFANLLPHTIQYFISVAACCTLCYLLPHAVQFAVCCQMPYGLLLVAACHTVCYFLPHAVQLLFLATCRILCYLLQRTVQLLLVSTCCTFCYLLPHTIQLAIYCRRPYCCYLLPLLPHAIHFAIGWCMPQNLLFVATYCTTCYYNSMLVSLLFITQYHACSFLFVAAYLTVCYWLPHPCIVCCLLSQAIQLVTCCSMPYSSLFVAACYTDCYLL